MNAPNVSTAADNAKRTCGALLTTLVDLGSTWAAYGLKVGKAALEQSADALGKTAHTLDTLATELDKKAAEARHEDRVVDADAVKNGAAPTADAPMA
jgi:uncharacterized protein YukE